ncbi:MAG TPA: hypothetical protein VN154_01610 [Rhizomicrobium sp.]|nr:hypothetical protein [Rhizomicrobium sp.]
MTGEWHENDLRASRYLKGGMAILCFVALVYVVALFISIVFNGYPLLPLGYGGYSCAAAGVLSVVWIGFCVRILRPADRIGMQKANIRH